MLFAVFFVSPDGWDEQKVGDQIADQDRDERETLGDGTPVVLGVDKGEGLDEHEDEGVTEPGQEGKCEDNGFGKEHLEGTDPGDEHLFEGESLLEGCDFVGPVEVGVCAVLASLLSDPVHHDGSSGLGDEDQMSELDRAAKDQLISYQYGPVIVRRRMG